MSPEQSGKSSLVNPLSLTGAGLTTLSAVALLNYLALEGLGLLESPYSGIFGFVALPILFVIGLLLIPVGIWHEGRRRQHGQPAWRWPTIDLQQARTRGIVLLVFVLTVVNLSILAVAAVGIVEYSESNEFCGEMCHTAMEPQYVAYQFSPHAQVACVSCHVVPGAAGMIDAKLNGTRQFYHVATGSYARPIRSDRDRLPVPADTCEACHSPFSPPRDLTHVYPRYNSDERSSEGSTTTLSIDGGAAHWHVRPDVVVEFVATDDTLEDIPWVRVTEGDDTTEFMRPGVASRPEGPIRRMNCLDCHNRPAHELTSTPEQIVDQAITSGAIDTSLPFTRRELVSALTRTYPDAEAARDGIARQLAQTLGTGPDVVQLVAFAQRTYATHVFPAMNVGWSTYTSMFGHSNRSAGCLRCHDNAHEARARAMAEGSAVRVVRRDCALCHSVIP